MRPVLLRLALALALAWTVTCGPAALAAADNQDLQHCRAIADDKERLACYDGAADRAPAESFGKKTPDTGSEVLQDIQSRVASVRTDASGKLILGLENGQTWAQIDSASLRLKPGDQILIRRGSLGSYLLARAGGGPEIRVRRR